MSECVITLPIIARYGTSSLLVMLNFCVNSVSAVNIDNGFGAGYLAGRINRIRTEGENKS